MGTICQLFDKKNIRTTSHYDGPILPFFSLSKRRQNEAPLGVGGGRGGGGQSIPLHIPLFFGLNIPYSVNSYCKINDFLLDVPSDLI